MNAWTVELLISADAVEPRALLRDAEHGLLFRLRHGVYVAAAVWQEAGPDERRILAARAYAAAADTPPIFSHRTAAALHGLPIIGDLRRLDVTVADAGSRTAGDIAGHVYALTEAEVVERGGLLLTSVARTVVDVAGSTPTEEGIVVADGALAAGIPKDLLLAAVDLAGPRKAARRIATVLDFAEVGSGSAAESTSRYTMHRLGVEKPVLQFAVWDAKGHAGDLDFFFPEADAGGEVDGLVKYLRSEYAPRGAGRKVYNEKIREDRVRAVHPRLARWGWAESRDTRLLRPILARVGVVARRVVRL